MVIHNSHNLPTIDYRTVKAFQHNLKDLETANHDKLLRRLELRGFIAPLYVWKHDGETFLIDGHQRQRVMMLNELNDNGNFEIPYVEIPAADEKTAKEILLEMTSQYGTVTVDGLDEYIALAELEQDELDINFDAINIDKFFADLEAPEPPEKPKPDKVLRWTLDELHNEAATFYDQTSSADIAAFLDYLAK